MAGVGDPSFDPINTGETHTQNKTKQKRHKTKANCETQKELTGFAPACPEHGLAKSFIAVRVVWLSRACLGKLYILLNKGALLLCCASNSRRRGCYKPRWGGGRLRPRGCATSTMITHFTAFLKRNAPALQLFIRIMMICNLIVSSMKTAPKPAFFVQIYNQLNTTFGSLRMLSSY